MNKTIKQSKVKDSGFKKELLQMLREAVRDVTDEEFEILNQKLDRILVKLDLLIQKQDQANNPYSLKSLLPRKINS